MFVIEWIGLMTVTGLIIFFIAGAWVLIENSDFIVTDSDSADWLIGVIVAIIFIFCTFDLLVTCLLFRLCQIHFVVFCLAFFFFF